MKKSRDSLDKFLEVILNKYITSSKIEADVIRICKEEYNLPEFRTRTIISNDASTAELREIEIYWILTAIKKVNKNADINVGDYFTDIEIENYNKAKFQEPGIKFPIVLEACQVNDNQWITTIDVATLIKWRSSLMRYNKEIQRRLETVNSNGITYEKISLNTSSVKKMVKLFENKEFVPNVITLNIPELESDFTYDKANRLLIINSIDHFDMTDGYHRLVALSKVLERNPFFSFTMELRITHFSEVGASFFIWQEEQRTPLPKKDVASYNLNSMENVITRRIADSTSCNLYGMIKRGGQVDFATFSGMVKELYVSKGIEQKMATTVMICNDLIKGINAITETHTDLLNGKMDISTIRIMVYCCHKYYKQDKADLPELFDYMRRCNYTKNEKITIAQGTSTATVKVMNKYFDKR